jgi:hypothetical protein
MRSRILFLAVLLQLAACDMEASNWSPSRGACRDRDTIPGSPLGAECWDWLSGGGSNR